MKAIPLLFTLVLFGSTLPGSAEELPAHLAGLARSNTAFALDLYGELKSGEGNLFFSPYSISTALAMTYGGARGNTAEEMARTLHLPMNSDRLHRAFSGLEERMGAILETGDIDLCTANALWPQEGYPLREEYLSLVHRHYGASVTPLDFAGSTEAARRTINGWVERRTRNRIRGLIRRGDLDPATVLVLVNVIYFRGSWARRFDPSNTREGPFTLEDGRNVDVEIMCQAGDFPYGESEEAQVLELPYAGNDLSLFVILPREGRRLSDIENALTERNLESWFSAPSEERIRVFLPKFRISWGTGDLAHPLISLGMRDAFLAGRADFSGMDGSRSLFIGSVLHKAFIEVNEEGSEAAASTAVVLKKGRPDERIFRADHPFLFLIRENTTGSILFLGRLTDPGQEG